jgi:hypothetical protein
MRSAAAFLLATLTALAASAHAETGARAAFAERWAMLEIDQRCGLLAPPVREALVATAAQARAALYRDAWSDRAVAELEVAAVAAARTRACADPRAAAAAERARLGFTAWARTHALDFPGAERVWRARRTPDPAGQWKLSQRLGGSGAPTFGVREVDGRERLSLRVAAPQGVAPPAMAALVVRDPARAAALVVGLPGLTSTGLARGAPPPGSARSFLASARRIETEGASRAVWFDFPDAAFAALLALDTREAALVRLDGGPAPLLLEIGDLAAARAFLAAEAPR